MSGTVRYSVADVPTVGRFMQSDAFIRALKGPFGSGKSSGCVMDFMGRSVRQKPGLSGKRRVRWSFIRNTMKQLEDTTLKTVLEWFPPHIYGEWRPSDMRYLIRGVKAPGDNEPCEIEVLFRALDRPEHVSNLLSLDLTAAWINEVREIPWAIVDAVQGRVGRFPPMRDNGGPSWFGVTMDTNPPDVDSKFHRFFEEEDHTEAVALLAKVIPGLTVDKYAKLFSQPSGLSPEAENLANLPKGYYERMAIGKSKEWIKVYIHGDYGFDLDGKAVFPEYDDDFHCKPCKTIEGRTIRRGWDMGLTPACIFSQLLPSGQWIIVDELVAESSGIDRFSDRVLEHSAVYFAGSDFEDDGDPAGMQRSQTDEKTCFQILHAKGIPIMPGEQGMTIRLESVRKPLMTTLEKGRPQFLIHPRCRVLRRGFMGGYHYRRIRVGADRFTDEPNKNQFCVPLTAEALTPKGWVPHTALLVGDEIYGYEMEKGEIVRTTVRAVNIFRERSRCVEIAADHFSFTASEAHNHVVETRAGIRKMVKADGLNDGLFFLAAASEDRPRKYRPFSDDFISLCAWVSAEGTYRKDNEAILLCQSTTHNPDYCDYLSALAGRYPGVIEHGAGQNGMKTWRITKETAWLVRQWMPNKYPSAEFVARMCNGARRLFLYEFVRGDGHAGGNLPPPGKLSRARDFAPKGITPRLYQKERGTIDALQMMATLSGLRTYTRFLSPKSLWDRGLHAHRPHGDRASRRAREEAHPSNPGGRLVPNDWDRDVDLPTGRLDPDHGQQPSDGRAAGTRPRSCLGRRFAAAIPWAAGRSSTRTIPSATASRTGPGRR